MALVSKTFSQIITFTRASTGTYFDSAGVLQSAAIDAPRLDYNPSTLAAQGLLIEEARTNGVRNNTMQGAVAGTPGTLPTNWAVSGLGTLTQQVVGTGTSNGITYIDIRFSGTTSTTQVGIRLEPSNGAAGTNGQTFTFSAWVARVAGSTSNIGDISANANVFDSGSVFLSTVTFTGYPVTAPTTLSRASGTGTIASASAAFIQPQIYINFASGVAIDITLRIGLPQLEQGAFATSVIPTTTTALTRSADVASVNTLSPWFNSAAGTLFAQVSLITVSNDANRFVAALSDGTTANYIGSFRQTDQQPVGQVQTSLGTQAALGAGAVWTTTASRKLALSYATNDFKFCTNGGTVFTDTAGTVPTVMQLQLGVIGSGFRLNGWLERVTFYPRSFSGAELQTITA